MAEEVKKDLEKMLLEDNARMRKAGCKLAEASLRVIREYDGLHRLSLAVAEWSQVIANEGGRSSDSERDTMTLDEAIIHCNEIADGDCSVCGSNHRMLAFWLTEYRGMKENA